MVECPSSEGAALACKANHSVRSWTVDELNTLALKNRCPPAVCCGAPTNHDLTWLIVGAGSNFEEPWDPAQNFTFTLPAGTLGCV
jgi:hypothetical protein